ncbi:MAG: tetratricopeptide repeat protein [Myxococcota bacterium]
MSRAPLLSLLSLGAALCASTSIAVGQEQQAPNPPEQDRNAPRTEDVDATPWDSATDTTLPPFLQDTEKRVVDERPAPTEAQLDALRQLEAEVGRFSESGGTFRDTVTSLVRREYLQQRRARDRWYGVQIEAEDQAFNDARREAIEAFERFIQAYPNEPGYTPDAMFRLGELYFEESAVEFQDLYDEAQAAREAGDLTAEDNLPASPDFTPTIELYKQLARRFPNYERSDGVYYLIGYTLNESGRPEEAVAAWLALVCANKYDYDPDWRPPPLGASSAEIAKYPALTLDGRPLGANVRGEFVDPYEGCEPTSPDARFVSETWFRVGEYHFDDFGGDNALDLSIAAYDRILEDPEDRNYNLALYKVAWAYYRASRYPEAIRNFSKLVQWSDDAERETGRAGSELRPEAIEYLGIAFAYDDWNENQVADRLEGQATGIERIQDAGLMPQERPWTPEVYFQLGQVYFDEAKYPEAIAAWRLAIQKWPNHPRTPEVLNDIAVAHQMYNEFDEAIATRGELTEYVQGSPWWNANMEHPREQQNAEQLAENALIVTAIHHHSRAQRLRQQCVEERNVRLCRDAQREYALAATAYREYLERYPNNPQGYELHYNLADALYWSEDYEQAATEYAEVRDSNVDDTYMSESARRVVESLKRISDRDVEEGRLVVREEAPPAVGTPPTVGPVAMPSTVQRLARAREIYLSRVGSTRDVEGVRPAYDYNNALLLYWYGYWPQAKSRFTRIYEERCSGPDADATGQVAWENLRAMAVAEEDSEEIRRLATDIQERGCTFSAGSAAIDCSRPANREQPICRAGADLNALVYQDALEVYRRAGQASGAEQRALYEQSATMLLSAVNANPNDKQAPIALEYAALALEATNRYESAGTLYQRIIDEVGPREAEDPEEQQSLDAILANAHFKLAYNAARYFDFDRAVENYRVLADSKRFANSTDPAVQQKRADGLVNSAIMLEQLQQYKEATKYYRRVYDTVDDPEVKRTALYRIGEMAYRQRRYVEAIGGMRNFIAAYGNDDQAGELVVQAYWRIAQSEKARGRSREYRAALGDVTKAFERTGQPAGSVAAGYAAEARFILADGRIDDFEKYEIKVGRPRTMEGYTATLAKQIDQGSAEAQSIVGGYEPVLEYRRPRWTIASFVRQGRTYEILARAVLNAPFVMPLDMQKQLRKLDEYDREDIRLEVEDRVRQLLDEKVRPIECFAVARYALAARAARAGSFDDEYTRTAIDRLQAYGDERIAECIAEAQARDRTFQGYTPGEFARSPRGRPIEIRPGVAPPAITQENP